jgi:hypothetical protein
VRQIVARTFSEHLEKKTIPAAKETYCKRKKSRAFALLQKLCRPYFPENLDLILIDGTTLLVRVRAPPETWTTRLRPLGQPEPALLDHLFRLVTIFGNDCSKFEQFWK